MAINMSLSNLGICFTVISITFFCLSNSLGAQWLSGRVLESRPKGPGFKPHRRHCVVSLCKTHRPGSTQ